MQIPHVPLKNMLAYIQSVTACQIGGILRMCEWKMTVLCSRQISWHWVVGSVASTRAAAFASLTLPKSSCISMRGL